MGCMATRAVAAKGSRRVGCGWSAKTAGRWARMDVFIGLLVAIRGAWQLVVVWKKAILWLSNIFQIFGDGKWPLTCLSVAMGERKQPLDCCLEDWRLGALQERHDGWSYL